MSVWRIIKDLPVVQHLLLRQCRALLDQGRASNDPKRLTEARAFYALERRVRECLERKPCWGIDEATSRLHHRSFLLVREMLDFLIQRTSGDERRAHNRSLNRLEMLAKWPELRSYPLRCYFETTNRCNLRCQMCGQSFFRGKRVDMPREAVEQLSPLFDFMDDVSIFGYGEALLVDYIPNLLDAIPPHANSWLVTNGLLLTREKNKMLVEHGLKTLFVSIDAASRETYRLVRHVDAFERVIAQVRDLEEQKRVLGSQTPRLTLTFVAMRRNIDELPEFVRLARRLGIDRVIADYLIVYSENMRDQSLVYDQEHSDRVVEEALRAAREENVDLTAPIRFSDPADRAVRKPRCVEPWEFIYFRADGFVQPCCTNSDTMERWTGARFFDYWNCPAYQDLRRTLYTEQQSHWCRGCVHVCYRDIRRESSHLHIMPESVAAAAGQTADQDQ
ncbi:radical SAM protein [Candidatus Sumerlaeota bacterium]|nr:radical SAM protein [Candidatus Sumerlaeota bacterium]